MGNKFLLALLTLSAFFLSLHAAADGSPPAESDLSRSLHQNSEPERTGADPPSEAEAPAEWESRKIGKHHHSSDGSVAGGGVIIGGLVTVAFAAVYCYIRVTRRKRSDNLS
ncbi:uncharacterized protein LOC121759103 [Salvia splendens]|uniref:uncharacterized protein LOC121759103 n=1 Tax=Salvia splendens TaxID=180675 RepID=UPI001C267291|nr:uncharacterized protein LOC121759103 [Salvia splendens]